MSFKLLKKQLKNREKLFSVSLHRRKHKEEPKKSILRTSEMIYRYKNWKRKLVITKERKQKRDLDKSKNFKLLKIIKFNSKPRELKKKEEWNKNLKLKWLKSLLRMNVLSR
jgi:hypothetical protein